MSFTIQPAEGPTFVNRELELKDILSTLKDPSSTMGFALYGKRRMGKTSLLKETHRRLLKETNDIVPVYFSIWNLIEKNVVELVRELTVAILDEYRPHLSLPHKAKDLLVLPINFIKNLFSGLKLNVDLQDSLTLIFSLGKEKMIEPNTLIEEVFTLPEKLAVETNKKSVLLIDEFPDITDVKINGKTLKETVIKKIRTIQEGYKRTSLNVSGSTRRTMESAILSSSSAFYRQFIVKEIGPFSESAVKELMDKNLMNGKLSSESLRLLYDFTAGIPFYVQFLGRLLNKYTTTTLKPDIIKKTIDEFLTQEGDLIFKEELAKLSSKERLIVTTMSTKDPILFSEISQTLSNQITNLGRYLTYLEENDIIQKEERGQYVFTDPIFKKWLAKKFLV